MESGLLAFRGMKSGLLAFRGESDESGDLVRGKMRRGCLYEKGGEGDERPVLASQGGIRGREGGHGRLFPGI